MFHEPGHLEMAQWIRKNTPKDAVLAGSMSTMAEPDSFKYLQISMIVGHVHVLIR